MINIVNLINSLKEDRNNGQERIFKKRFPDHYKNICSWSFPESFRFSQKIYHYIHNDEELKLGICQCGKRCKYKNYILGYYHHCSNKCSQNDEHTKEQRILTNVIKYGTDNPSKNDDIKHKQIQTNNIRYGYNSPSCVNEINLKQRSASYITKKKRNTFNTSNAEELFHKYLIEHNIKCERQYKSSVYPFQCDFYINTYDLYVEIQGNWTHGGDTSLHTHPHMYNPNNELDIKQANLWCEKSKYSKYYENALYNWTVRDVNKRIIAMQNNLQYLEIFSYDINTIVNEFENYVKKIKN